MRLLLSSIVVVAVANSSIFAEDVTPSPAKLRKQIRQHQLERRDLLRKLAAADQPGVAKLDQVIRTQRRLVDAELAVADESKSVAILEAAERRAAELRDRVQRKLELGTADTEAKLAAEVARQTLAIRLALKARGESNDQVRVQQPKLRDMLQEQRASVKAKFEAGEVRLEVLTQLQQRLMQAEIRCCDDAKQRLTAAERVLKLGQEVEAIIKTQLLVGRSDSERAALATGARIKLQLELLSHQPESEKRNLKRKQLLAELEEVSLTRLQAVQAKYEAGEALLESVADAGRDVAQARLQLRKDKAGRLEAARQLVESARQSYNLVRVQGEFGRVREEQVFRARVGLLDAEIDYFREQLRWAQ